MRTLSVALLLAACALGSDVASRIGALASEDPFARAAARRWLARHIDDCGPALERALDATDAEIRAAASRLLEATGHFGPLVRSAVSRADLDVLRGADPVRRRIVAMRLARRGPTGREALRLTYSAGGAPDVAVVPVRTTVYASNGRLHVHVTNRDRVPGWAGWPEGRVETKWRRGFGRSVSFFGLAGRGFGRRLRGKRVVRYGAVVNTAGKFEWLVPGQTGSNVATLRCDVPWPGVWSATSSATVPDREARFRDRGHGLDLTRIPVRCAENAPGTFEIHAIPRANVRGRPVEATKLRAALEGRAVVLRLISDGKTLAPADFSSSWYVLLDGSEQVIDYGPVAGGAANGHRVYRRKELTAVSELRIRVPAPRRGAYALYGTRFTRGSAWGAEAISDRVALR